MSPTFKSGETPEMRQALDELLRSDPDLAEARRIAGALPDRRRDEGFATLMLLIVEQQVSLASARAIWSRVSEGLPDMSPDSVLSATDDDLRGFGLSRPKVVYCRALAEAVTTGTLPLDRLSRMDDDEALSALVGVKGIGRWTAEVYLLFSLGRRDIFPAGDVALQAAAKDVKKLPERPTGPQMYEMAEIWRPHRGVAAQLLWRYYGVTRGRADPVSVDEANSGGGR